MMKLSDIAAALDARLEGDGTLEIRRAVHPSDAEGPMDLALAMDKKLVPLLAGGKAVAAVVREGMEGPADLAARIIIRRPATAMAGLMGIFEKPAHFEPGLHPMACIHPTARLEEGVSVGPFAVIGPRAVVGAGSVILPHVTIGADVRIGPGCLIHPGARIGDRVEMGARCIVHPNAAIGNDGFSFATPEPGSVETAKATGRIGGANILIQRVNSIGTVIIGDEVEVGAGATIDRGTVAATRIGSGTKIDNLVQIGHNCVIGSNCMICGHTGLAGSVTVGDRVVMAGKTGVADHVTIGHDAVLAASAGVGTDVPAKSIYMGLPAVPRSQFFDQIKGLGRLKRLYADVAAIKASLAAGRSTDDPA